MGLVVQGQEGVDWDEWLALARAAEESGLDCIFGSDHYRRLIAHRDGALDIWTVLAGIAAVTSRLRLGSLVSPVTFRHPSVLARIVVTVGEISGGRAELGLGAGWHEGEHREHGFPFPPLSVRLEQLYEQAEIVGRSWKGEPFDFEGSHYRLENCGATPVAVPRPNLIVGGTAKPGTIAPAVAFADEYNTHFVDVEGCRARRQAVDAACEAVGREPLAFSLMMGCIVAPTEVQLKRRVERLTSFIGRPPDPARVIMGTTEAVVERLSAYADAGVDRVFLQDNSRNLDLIGDYGVLARMLAG